MSEDKRFNNNGSLIFDNKMPMNTNEVVDVLNELNDFKDNVFKVIDKKKEWHLLQSKKCRNQGNIKKAIKFEEAIMTLSILRRDIE